MIKEGTRYRSRIDELVVNSGLTGLKIAREMGITKNRIIALRRAQDKNISTDDLSACQAAILRLGGDIIFNQDGDLVKAPESCPSCQFINSANKRIEEQSEMLREILKRMNANKEGG